jgi:hypothetical protein
MAKNITRCPWDIEVEGTKEEYHDFSDHYTCAELDAKNRSMARKMKKKQEVQPNRQEQRERKQKQELEESERAKKQAQVAVKQFIQSCLLELSTPQDKLLNEKRNKLSLSAQHYFDKYIQVLREEKERRNRWKIEKEIVEAVEAYSIEVDNTIEELFNT